MAQFARPASDSATGTWSNTPLWSKVNEGSPGDDTTIQSDDNTSPDNADFTTNSVNDPSVSTGHTLRAAWNKDSSGGHSINAVLELWQGDPAASGTLVATLSVTGIGVTKQEDTYTLSGAEADSITDYSSLYLRVSRQGDTGGPPGDRRRLVVDFIELEVPDAGQTFTQSVSGSITPAGSLTRRVSVSANVSGSITPSGGLTKRVSKQLSGAITAAGALTKKTILSALTGSITAAGSLASQMVVQTTVTGSVTPSGSLSRGIKKAVSGSVTATGSLSRHISKTLLGSVTPVGAVVKKMSKLLTGSITPSGSLSTLGTFFQSVSGAVTALGSLATTYIAAGGGGSIRVIKKGIAMVANVGSLMRK